MMDMDEEGNVVDPASSSSMPAAPSLDYMDNVVTGEQFSSNEEHRNIPAPFNTGLGDCGFGKQQYDNDEDDVRMDFEEGDGGMNGGRDQYGDEDDDDYHDRHRTGSPEELMAAVRAYDDQQRQAINNGK